ncbi:MAG: 5-formyltetrahydrofolate cyclo-ligase [Deltaproteobacteria bacterium]|nr:5-formyltetrahydrofolate cyclo-ligase [Candidatus Zymogenaceae bacterium]
MTKNEIRKEILARRLGLSDSQASFRSEAICRRIISDDIFITASVIGLYWPFRKEVLTQSLFRTAVSERKRVGFPLVRADDHTITYIAVDDPAEMRTGTYGIVEPRFDVNRVIRPEELDLIIIPGVAFDRRGYRIGYGVGYFDRLLTGDAVTATRAAPAFDIQIVDRVPQKDHDRKVDIIFTESRVIKCS